MMKSKIAVAIAAFSIANVASATVAVNSGLATAMEAIGSAYMTFGASSSNYSTTLGHLQDLVEYASAHGTYDDTSVTFTLDGDGNASYTINVTTHDNSTNMTNSRNSLIDSIEADFYGAADNDISDISITKSGGTWDMTAGTVLTTWGDCVDSASVDCNNLDSNDSSGLITELNDLETALNLATDGDYSAADKTALNGAINNLDDSITVLEAGLDDIDDGLGTNGTGRGATAANWQLGRSNHTLDLSATDYTVQLNGVNDSDQSISYLINNVAGNSAITVRTVVAGSNVDTQYSNLDDYVCEIFTQASCT